MTIRRKWRRRLLSVFFVVLAAALVADITFFARDLVPEPVSAEAAPKVDMIVVLTGGRGRLKEALALLVQGTGQQLFISGVEPGTELRKILEANQIPTALPEELESKIQLGTRSRSTSENALEVSELVASNPVASILLVTSTYHMRRARELVERAFDRQGRARPTIYAYPVESPNFGRDNWWTEVTGWRVLISEYLKNWAIRLGLAD